MRTCAVIGGNGFIGSHLVNGLLGPRSGHVLVLSRSPPERRGKAPDRARHAQVDMRDQARLTRELQGVETLFHLGATIPNASVNAPEAVWEGNVAGAAAVVASCKAARVKNLIYVTGHLAPPPGSSHGELAFLHAKAATEKAMLEANGQDGVGTCSVRAPVIFGPGDKITSSFLQGKAPIFPHFPRTFSFMYVDDLVRMLIQVEDKLAERSESVTGRALDAIGEPMTFEEFFALPEWDRAPPRFVSYHVIRWLAALNVSCARLFGAAPLGPEMCPQVLDSMALHHKKKADCTLAEALELTDRAPPSVAAGIRALLHGHGAPEPIA